MNEDALLNLQAWVDGELSPSEGAGIAALVATDADARALAGELRTTRDALRGNELSPCLPETREFHWSKIRREIQRLERRVEYSGSTSYLSRCRRLLIPTGIMTVFLAVLLLSLRHSFPAARAEAAPTETSLADSGALTYRDQAEGVTFIWLSYPPENEFAADGDTDTL